MLSTQRRRDVSAAAPAATTGGLRGVIAGRSQICYSRRRREDC